MAKLVISWISIAVSLLIVYRGLHARLLSRYPFFYVFLIGAVAMDWLLLIVYREDPRSYGHWYWTCEFLSLVLACGIVLEIFRNVLSRYSRAERFARFIGVAAFAVILFSSGIYPVLARHGSVGGTMEELERNIRWVQAIFLMLVLLLIRTYGIRIGRNMKGMIAGYGLSVGTSLASMAADTYTGGRFADGLALVWQLGYAVPLGIWAIALWSYSASQADESSVRIDQDYENLIGRVHGTLHALRGYVGKGVSS